MSLGDIIVLSIVFGLLFASAVWYYIRRKNGKNSCGRNCSSCPYKTENCDKKTSKK